MTSTWWTRHPRSAAWSELCFAGARLACRTYPVPPMRLDLGRRLSADARAQVVRDCVADADLQIAIGDGLSAAAVVAQVPPLLPLLEKGARERGWSFGRPFVIRYCRVGVLNDIGELL